MTATTKPWRPAVGERELLVVRIEEVLFPEGRPAKPEVVDTLVESIKRVGLINPLTVVRRGEQHEVVAGVNRLAACWDAELMLVTVIVLGEGEAAREIELDENLARLHLTPEQLAERREWAKAELRRCVGAGQSLRTVAKKVGLSKSSACRNAGVPSGTPAFSTQANAGAASPAPASSKDAAKANAGVPSGTRASLAGTSGAKGNAGVASAAPASSKDAAKANAGVPSGTPASSAGLPGARTNAGVPSGTRASLPDTPAVRRTGLDGKSYPATQPTTNEKATRAQRAKVLRDDGRTVKEIARELGVSLRTAAADLATEPAVSSADGEKPTPESAPATETIAVTVPATRDLVQNAREGAYDGDAPISIDVFARLVGTTADTVAAWESGAATPSGPEVLLLQLLSQPDTLDAWVRDRIFDSIPMSPAKFTRKCEREVAEKVARVRRGQVVLALTQREPRTPEGRDDHRDEEDNA